MKNNDISMMPDEFVGLLDLPHYDALAKFASKGIEPSFSYADMTAEEHSRAFTIAKMANADLLNDVHKSLIEAQKKGDSFQTWRKQIEPTLRAKGWWGKKSMKDPLTGKNKLVQTGSAARLETIFRTNMQSSYAAGQWQQIQRNKQSAPWLLYDAVDDNRTRSAHRAMDGTVLPVDHAWWQSHYPPNGYRCRCNVIQMDDDDLVEDGLKPTNPPNAKMAPWRNPRTGNLGHYPVDPVTGQWMVNPQFYHHPVEGNEIKEIAQQKQNNYTPEINQAVADSRQTPPPIKPIAEPEPTPVPDQVDTRKNYTEEDVLQDLEANSSFITNANDVKQAPKDWLESLGGILPSEFVNRMLPDVGFVSQPKIRIRLSKDQGKYYIGVKALSYTSTGDVEIEMNRYMIIPDNDSEDAIVKHEFLELSDKGGGKGKQILKSQMDFYREIGVRKVFLFANVDIGGYAWARYGFLPVNWDSTKKEFAGRLNRFPDGENGISNDDKQILENLLASDNPEEFWAISDTQAGKRLLLNSDWDGYIDLKDQSMMDRFEQYVNRSNKIRGSSQDNNSLCYTDTCPAHRPHKINNPQALEHWFATNIDPYNDIGPNEFVDTLLYPVDRNAEITFTLDDNRLTYELNVSSPENTHSVIKRTIDSNKTVIHEKLEYPPSEAIQVAKILNAENDLYKYRLHSFDQLMHSDLLPQSGKLGYTLTNQDWEYLSEKALERIESGILAEQLKNSTPFSMEKIIDSAEQLGLKDKLIPGNELHSIDTMLTSGRIKEKIAQLQAEMDKPEYSVEEIEKDFKRLKSVDKDTRKLFSAEKWQRVAPKHLPSEFIDKMLPDIERGKNNKLKMLINKDSDGNDWVELMAHYYDDDSNPVLETTRNINFTRKFAEHENFHVFDSGRGVGRKFLSSQVNFYQELGLTRVDLYANIDVGGYAWARYGFLPTHKHTSMGIKNEINDKHQNGLLSDYEKDLMLGLINRDDTKFIWAISDHPLGKEVLLNSQWVGQLDLSDRDSLDRFNRYIKKKRVSLAQQFERINRGVVNKTDSTELAEWWDDNFDKDIDPTTFVEQLRLFNKNLDVKLRLKNNQLIIDVSLVDKSGNVMLKANRSLNDSDSFVTMHELQVAPEYIPYAKRFLSVENKIYSRMGHDLQLVKLDEGDNVYFWVKNGIVINPQEWDKIKRSLSPVIDQKLRQDPDSAQLKMINELLEKENPKALTAIAHLPGDEGESLLSNLSLKGEYQVNSELSKEYLDHPSVAQQIDDLQTCGQGVNFADCDLPGKAEREKLAGWWDDNMPATLDPKTFWQQLTAVEGRVDQRVMRINDSGQLDVTGVHVDELSNPLFAFERRFDLQSKTAFFDKFEVSQDRLELARGILRHEADLMDKMGIETVISYVDGDDAAYAFAKYGFLPDDWDALRTNLMKRTSDDGLISLLNDDNPYTLWAIADHPKGRALLNGASYKGRLSLRDPVQRDRLNQYIRGQNNQVTQTDTTLPQSRIDAESINSTRASLVDKFGDALKREGVHDHSIAEWWADHLPNYSPDDFLDRLSQKIGDRFNTHITVDDGLLNISFQVGNLDGENIASIERRFDFAELTAYLGKKEFSGNTGLLSDDLVKSSMRDEIELLQSLGFKNINALASFETGGYAWARYGLLPSNEDWPTQYNTLNVRVEQLKNRFDEGDLINFDESIVDNIKKQLDADNQDALNGVIDQLQALKARAENDGLIDVSTAFIQRGIDLASEQGAGKQAVSDWLDMTRDMIRNGAILQAQKADFDDLLNMIDADDRFSLWALSDHPLGKTALMNQLWHGQIDLRNEAQTTRLNHYLSRRTEKVDAVSQNIRSLTNKPVQRDVANWWVDNMPENVTPESAIRAITGAGDEFELDKVKIKFVRVEGRRALALDAHVHYEGDKVAEISRHIYTEGGLDIEHNWTKVIKENAPSNFGKRVMSKSLEFYKTANFRRILNLANDSVGSYAWAKYGYLPRTQDDWNALRHNLEARRLAMFDALPEEKKTDMATMSLYGKVKRLLKKDDPTALWNIADTPLGKPLLLNPDDDDSIPLMWYGQLDLNNSDQVERLQNYIG